MFKMRWCLKTILLIYLAAAAVQDIKSKRVALRPALIVAALGVLLHLGAAAAADPGNAGTQTNPLITEMLTEPFAIGTTNEVPGSFLSLLIEALPALLSSLVGTLPGIFLLAVGWATHQEVGYGDGVVLLIIGIYLGFSAGISIFLTALLFIAPVSLFYIACRKAGRKKKLPFIPFLLAGYLLWLAADIF